MEKKNAEILKFRKDLKDMWAKEQKKLSECKATLKAAKSKYLLLGQELARVSLFLYVQCVMCACTTYNIKVICTDVVKRVLLKYSSLFITSLYYDYVKMINI